MSMNRAVWFVAGATTGVYAMVKARRVAEALTPEGLRDRLAGLSLGAQLFTEEVRTEMAARENDLRNRLGLGFDETTRDRRLAASRPLELTREGNS